MAGRAGGGVVDDDRARGRHGLDTEAGRASREGRRPGRGAGNLLDRFDRDSLPFSSPTALDPSRGQYFFEQTGYDPALDLPTLPSGQSTISSTYTGSSELSPYSAEHDLLTPQGWRGSGDFPDVLYTYTRDSLGRLTKISRDYQSGDNGFSNTSTFASQALAGTSTREVINGQWLPKRL